jgi:hypothetical protein
VKIPQLFASCSPVFSLSECSYNICRNKMGTARYVVFNEFQLVNSFTLEISMFAAISSSDSHLSSLSSQELDVSDTAVRPRTFRDTIHGASGALGGSNSSVSDLIPQHLEKSDFMRLSRDFATCLSTSDLSWMVDQDGSLIKMSFSPTSSFIYEIPDYQDTEILTPERKHVFELLWSHNISLLGDEKEPPTDSRLLGECKSINWAGKMQADVPSLSTHPISTKMMKILLCSVRAHNELQGEASHTRSLVQSFILNQLRAHVRQTDIAQLHQTLRALGDWMEFVLNFNKKDCLQREEKEFLELDIDPSAQILSSISVCNDLSLLDAVRRRINDALQRMKLPQTDSTYSCIDCDTKIFREVEKPVRPESESSVVKSTESLYKSTAAALPRETSRRFVHATPSENEFSLTESTLMSPFISATISREPSQPSNSCVKPWSLSLSVPDAQSLARPSPTISQAIDACSIRSSPPSVGSRIRLAPVHLLLVATVSPLKYIFNF